MNCEKNAKMSVHNEQIRWRDMHTIYGSQTMTELLSREEEYHKINERLNKLSQKVMDKEPSAIPESPMESPRQPPQPHVPKQLLNYDVDFIDFEEEQQSSRKSQQLNKLQAYMDETHSEGGQAIKQQKQETKKEPHLKQTDRFSTYTKSKGETSLLKKRGAGDIGSEDSYSDGQRSTGNTVARNSQMLQQYGSKTANGIVKTMMPLPVAQGTTDSESADSSRKSCNPKQAASNLASQRASNVSNVSGKPPDAAAATIRANNTRSNATTRNTNNRSNALRAPTKNSNNFKIRYRNPNFLLERSLHDMLDEHCKTLQSEDVAAQQENDLSANSGGKQLSTEGLIKFLKSKVSILEEDNVRMCEEISTHKILLEKSMERQKKVEQQRDHAFMKHNAIAEQLTKIESQLDEANMRAKGSTADQTAQHKELETIKREIKVLTQTNVNLEKRLFRANEELESVKSTLNILKNADRECKEAARIEIDNRDTLIKSLKKQRADLLNAYRKQLFLIDNLKRQNVLMEQSKMINIGEKEFAKVLEWNSKSSNVL